MKQDPSPAQPTETDETEAPKKARDLVRKALPNAVRTGIRAGDYCSDGFRGRRR